MKNLLAATVDIGTDPLNGPGPLGNPGGDAGGLLNTFLSSVIGILTIIGFIFFTFVLISGAIGIISSGGDKVAYESARKRISTGLIGVVVIVAAIFIVRLVGALLGIEDSILDPGGVIEGLAP